MDVVWVRGGAASPLGDERTAHFCQHENARDPREKSRPICNKLASRAGANLPRAVLDCGLFINAACLAQDRICG